MLLSLELTRNERDAAKSTVVAKPHSKSRISGAVIIVHGKGMPFG